MYVSGGLIRKTRKAREKLKRKTREDSSYDRVVIL